MSTVVMPSDDSLARMETELCCLAARVAASMCLFLEAVAEYDRIGAWERWECHDMAGWLSWKCGIAPGTAREYVRVARAVEELPQIKERFKAGQLSYSQVRAVTRIADGAKESYLIELAESSTGAQLEKIVRAYRRCADAQSETEERRDQGRYLRYGWDDDGNLTGSFKLTPEMGAVFVSAIESATTREAVEDADADGARQPKAAAQADALMGVVVAGHRAAAGTSSDTGPEVGGGEVLVTVVVDEEALSPRKAQADADGDGQGTLCELEDGPALAAETARRLACDATEVRVTQDSNGNPLDVGRRTRRINKRLRKALSHRDGRCQYPGCGRTSTQAHHIQHWADGGETSLGNLISLCWRHHRRLHEGGFRILVDANGRWQFIHPGGWVIDPGPMRPDPHLIPAAPTVEPFQDHWDGTRLDLPMVIDGLLQCDGRLVPPPDGSAAWN